MQALTTEDVYEEYHDLIAHIASAISRLSSLDVEICGILLPSHVEEILAEGAGLVPMSKHDSLRYAPNQLFGHPIFTSNDLSPFNSMGKINWLILTK